MNIYRSESVLSVFRVFHNCCPLIDNSCFLIFASFAEEICILYLQMLLQEKAEALQEEVDDLLTKPIDLPSVVS